MCNNQHLNLTKGFILNKQMNTITKPLLENLKLNLTRIFITQQKTIKTKNNTNNTTHTNKIVT